MTWIQIEPKQGAAYIGIGKGEDAGYHQAAGQRRRCLSLGQFVFQVGFYFMLVMTCALSGIKDPLPRLM